MADRSVVHVGENSPQKVAYDMADKVLITIEQKSWSKLTRKEYLDTYAECLSAVLDHRSWQAPK